MGSPIYIFCLAQGETRSFRCVRGLSPISLGPWKLYASFKIFKENRTHFFFLIFIFLQSHKSLCRLGKLIGTWSWLEFLENRKHMTSKSFHTMSVSHILQTGMARTKRQGWHLNDPFLATGVTWGGIPSDYVKCCYKPGKNDMIMWGCPEMGMPNIYGNTVETPYIYANTLDGCELRITSWQMVTIPL